MQLSMDGTNEVSDLCCTSFSLNCLWKYIFSFIKEMDALIFLLMTIEATSDTDKLWV